ncbi:DUF1800 domain-containing protein [Xylophilus sp. ASV27]|uniref:DUF1800 domain-containing protein n=1 Tax=Xylophilus sp. ASV27 TaxID=2795129 RepID=UPI0018EA8D74|nr:DUF1800 domain-containing protein [Xylophilus sp. ASV27]
MSLSPRCRLGLLAAPLLAAACAPFKPAEPDEARAAVPEAELRKTDARWLNRVLFWGDDAALARLRAIGRARFLDEQLAWPLEDPPGLAAAIAVLPVAQQSAEQRYRAMRAEQQRINTLPDEDARQQARSALNRAGNEATQETAARHMLRALYSPAQLREQMTWFWMNHFSVYAGKGAVRWTLGDYEDKAVRPRAFGRFHDLVMATLTAPAMLDFLDNAQSAAGRINENYARELMELHTLGVSGGPSGSRYTQQDVQELARILTGVGIDANGQPPRLPPQRQALYLHQGLFEFNPARHDFGGKTLLGQRIDGAGFAEVEQAVALLVRQPATARFISHKLAVYFVADTPPPALVERMAATFQRSQGDIAAVLRTLFLAPEMQAVLAGGSRKFKDPMQYVTSSMRMAYAERPAANMRPVTNWLAQLGEPLYGRITPDGYPLGEAAWASSGQMVKRFEIARAMGTGQAALYADDAGKPLRAGFPLLATRSFYALVEPTLGPATRRALADAASQPEWNTVLLSSPEWMQR